jgi:hypothetical protein
MVESLANPKRTLHVGHRSPRTLPVSWQWSTCRAFRAWPLAVSAGNSTLQMAHLPFWFSYLVRNISSVMPYRRLRAVSQAWSELRLRQRRAYSVWDWLMACLCSGGRFLYQSRIIRRLRFLAQEAQRSGMRFPGTAGIATPHSRQCLSLNVFWRAFARHCIQYTWSPSTDFRQLGQTPRDLYPAYRSLFVTIGGF